MDKELQEKADALAESQRLLGLAFESLRVTALQVKKERDALLTALKEMYKAIDNDQVEKALMIAEDAIKFAED